MSFGDFDFAQGTDFERAWLRYLWNIRKQNSMNYCKPDIYDVENDIFFEVKYTRPYYDKDPEKHSDAKDVGSGLPAKQFYRYEKIINNGHSKVILIHGMKNGKYKNKIFCTELTGALIDRINYSYNRKTVYWNYSDLVLITNVSVDDLLTAINVTVNIVDKSKYTTTQTKINTKRTTTKTGTISFQYEINF